MGKFSKKLRELWKRKKIWARPKHKNILLYGQTRFDVLCEYIEKRDIEIIDFGAISVFIFLKAIIRGKTTADDYLDTYIRYVKPKVFLSFMDNSLLLYKIKSRHPNLIVIIIQNGTRAVLDDIFGYLQTKSFESSALSCDYIVVHNKLIGLEYQKYISCNILVSGSMDNNYINRNNVPSSRAMRFIVQLPIQLSYGTLLPDSFDGELSHFPEPYRANILLLPILRDFCKQNSLRLEILGKREDSTHEQDFFSKILGTDKYTYIPRKSRHANYYAVDSALCVVSIDSTLGYEAFSRGVRTAFFPIRGLSGPTEGTQFAWPAELPPEGNFWTSIAEKSNIVRVLEFITNVNDERWAQICMDYAPLVMNFDPGNQKVKALFKKIGISK